MHSPSREVFEHVDIACFFQFHFVQIRVDTELEKDWELNIIQVFFFKMGLGFFRIEFMFCQSGYLDEKSKETTNMNKNPRIIFEPGNYSDMNHSEGCWV